MTEIGFHYNAPDKLSYACRLVRKAVATRGMRVVVVGEAQWLDAIDAGLWQLAPTEFVAHCRGDAPVHVLSRSPVILADEGQSRPRFRTANCWSISVRRCPRASSATSA